MRGVDSAGSSCEATAELTEGPYYFDADALRSDIREDREGVTLRLGIRVRSAGDCAPIKDAVVDIWHCDAGGVYSGFEAGEGERYLRGTQVTNADGVAEFTTIYPGWYRGRTVHIHAKVHLDKQTRAHDPAVLRRRGQRRRLQASVRLRTRAATSSTTPTGSSTARSC